MNYKYKYNKYKSKYLNTKNDQVDELYKNLSFYLTEEELFTLSSVPKDLSKQLFVAYLQTHEYDADFIDKLPKYRELFTKIKNIKNKNQLNGYKNPISINFSPEFKDQLTIGDLPPGIKKLSGLGPSIKLDENIIPKSVISYEGNSDALRPGILSDSLLGLNINDSTSLIEPNTFPDSVIELKIDFNTSDSETQQIDSNILPKSLKCLKISNYKNKIITNNLPETLTDLTLISVKNDSLIPAKLPNTIKCLTIDDNIKLTENLLPDSLEYLKLDRYAEDIKNLPKSLKFLEITNESFINLPNDLPDNIKYIILGEHSNEILLNFFKKIPASLIKIKVKNQQFNTNLVPERFRTLIKIIPHSKNH